MAKQIRICSILGCDKKHEANGLCGMHYRRLQRSGQTGSATSQRHPLVGYCSVADCQRTAKGGGRGMCPLHYQRFRVNGDPNVFGRTPKGTLERWLNDHRDHQGEGCLTWPFFRDVNGYGNCHYSGQGMKASRAMCILAHGHPPEDEMDAAHSCGKGHEGCVHPGHLRWATKQDNCADMLDHGTRMMGEAVWSAKLTEDAVREIRILAGSLSQNKIAERFGVSRATVGDVVTRKGWKHVA